MLRYLFSLSIGMTLCVTHVILAKGMYARYDIQAMDKTGTLFGEIVAYYNDEKMRMEIILNRDKEALEKIIYIVDSKNKKSYTLFENSKTYVEFKYPRAKKHTHEKNYKPSNETKTIAGFTCEVFGKIKKNSVETVCVSEELYNKYKKLMDGLKHIGQKQSYYVKDIKGFPLEYQATIDGKTHAKLELKHFKEKNIKAKFFVIPRSYKKTKSLNKK